MPYCAEMHARGDCYGEVAGKSRTGAFVLERVCDPIATFGNDDPWTWRMWKHMATTRSAGPGSLTVELWTRCRKCPNCLAQRARLWRARARSEIGESPRTWFVTFTFNEGQRSQARNQARKLCWQRHAQGFDGLSSSEQFIALHEVLSRQLALMIKRLRKNTKSAIRYLLVAEAHADGFPHYHGLIHELEPGSVTERAIRAEWRGHNLGFVEAKLVEDAAKGAAYVCKYLTKSVLARVRASQRYGQGFGRSQLIASEAERKERKETSTKERKVAVPDLSGRGPQGRERASVGPWGKENPVFVTEKGANVSEQCMVNARRVSRLSPGEPRVHGQAIRVQEVSWEQAGRLPKRPL